MTEAIVVLSAVVIMLATKLVVLYLEKDEFRAKLERCSTKLSHAEWRTRNLERQLDDMAKPVGDSPYRITVTRLHPKVYGINPCTLQCECGRMAFVARVGHENPSIINIPGMPTMKHPEERKS